MSCKFWTLLIRCGVIKTETSAKGCWFAIAQTSSDFSWTTSKLVGKTFEIKLFDAGYCWLMLFATAKCHQRVLKIQGSSKASRIHAAHPSWKTHRRSLNTRIHSLTLTSNCSTQVWQPTLDTRHWSAHCLGPPSDNILQSTHRMSGSLLTWHWCHVPQSKNSASGRCLPKMKISKEFGVTKAASSKVQATRPTQFK